jgi:hypothetical protein
MQNSSAFQHLAIDTIHESTSNPRRTFDEIKLHELAESIRQHGLIDLKRCQCADSSSPICQLKGRAFVGTNLDKPVRAFFFEVMMEPKVMWLAAVVLVLVYAFLGYVFHVASKYKKLIRVVQVERSAI